MESGKVRVWLEFTYCGCGSPLVFAFEEWAMKIHYCQNGHRALLAHVSPIERPQKID